jgi:hypothetical protein
MNRKKLYELTYPGWDRNYFQCNAQRQWEERLKEALK